VGANLFVGNLAPDADEKLLFETFILFGTLIQTPKVARDETTGVSRGFGFVSYDSFEAADSAISSMNGQYLCNRPVTVNYAFKKDGRGERHGSAAERLLATQTRKALAESGVVPLAPSQFALQMQLQMQQQAQQAPLHLQAQMMYPSNVPAAMYYGNTMNPAGPMGAIGVMGPMNPMNQVGSTNYMNPQQQYYPYPPQ
jgi:RNA recognition motif-containing protein